VVAVIQPVLCATRVPGGKPAGISSLNSCCINVSRIAAVAFGEATCPRSSAAMSFPSPRAVVVLLRPARNAGMSSTPRRTTTPEPPRLRAKDVTRVGSSRSIRTFVARLLDRTIIRRLSSRSETSDPTIV